MPEIVRITFAVVVLFLLGYGLFRGSIGTKIFCGLIIFLLSSLWLDFFEGHSARERARRARCQSNLHQIAVAARMFQEEHTNQFPRTLQDLTNAFPKPKFYMCPSSGNQPGDLTNINEWTDYVFISPPGTNEVLAFCRPDNHKGSGGNVVFADGSIQWFQAGEFTNVLKHGRHGTP